MAATSSFENFDRKEKMKISSNRSFGFVFTAFFFLLSFLAWKKQSQILPVWLALGILMLIMATFLPSYLSFLNKTWNRFGLLLHRIVTPVVMFLMFFGVFLPIGFFLRVIGKLSLKKSFDPNLKTYWIPRSEPGPKPDSMKFSF